LPDLPADVAVVYSKPGCPYCREAIRFLNASGMRTEIRDVTQDRRAYEEMLAIYQRRLPGEKVIVPLIAVGGQFVSGFDSDDLTEVLHQHLSPESPGRRP
jgi:glutaredoxin